MKTGKFYHCRDPLWGSLPKKIAQALKNFESGKNRRIKRDINVETKIFKIFIIFNEH